MGVPGPKQEGGQLKRNSKNRFENLAREF